MRYVEENYLQLSGIQHYAFCPRQWALIHIEKQWTENYLTAEGRVLHRRAHDGVEVEKRGDLIIVRSLKVSSAVLGVSGECDIVEFHRSESGVSLSGSEGLWQPFPVEYKRGKAKLDDCDRLQLCAQVVCLEEMLCIEIQQGALFYGEPRRREQVVFTPELRMKLSEIIAQMHALYKRQHTPKSTYKKTCRSCSIRELCLPRLGEPSQVSVSEYLEAHQE
ncbi:MAG: CRISPR-associated protein Cas4 [Anaerovoracaceae bacterium]|jgi:CRISPR-associated exonuclease Cas4